MAERDLPTGLIPHTVAGELRAIASLANSMANQFEDELAPYAEDVEEAHEGLLAVLDHLSVPVDDPEPARSTP